MINSLVVPQLSDNYMGWSQMGIKKRRMQWYKSIPEITALLNMVAEDVVGSYHFEPVEKKQSNRNRVKSAEEFAMNNRYRRVLLAREIDKVVTGESFGWLGKIKKEQIKEALSDSMKRKYGIHSKEVNMMSSIAYINLVNKQFKINDEDLLRPRKYRYIASSSMNIIHDANDILGYQQNVNGQIVDFSPEEIIHDMFYETDGKVNGFTPVESLMLQLELLNLMWRNQWALQKKGGPDRIVVLKNEVVNSVAYKKIEQQLKDYNVIEESHGNMLFTGDISLENFQQLDAMQFKEVGLYVTGLIAMNWCIPKSRIPYIVQGSNSKADIGGSAESAYWKRIESEQDRVSEIENMQLWIPYFGVKLVWDKEYKQDEVVENTAEQLRLGNIEMTNKLLSQYQLKLSKDQLLRKMNLDEDAVEESEDLFESTGMLRQNMLPTSTVQSNQENQAMRQQKRDEQLSSQVKKGRKPLGV